MNKQSFIISTPDKDFYQVIYQKKFYEPTIYKVPIWSSYSDKVSSPTLLLKIYPLCETWHNNSSTSTLIYAPYKIKSNVVLDINTDSKELDVEDKYDYLFSMSFRWNGSWDSRVYFPDDEEYWSSDIVVFGVIIPEIEYQCKLILSEYDKYLLSKLDESV